MACITTSFVRALVDADASVLDTLLKIGKCNFHIDDMIENEMPALHFAVIFRLVDAVKVLLKHGANVNLKDKDGKTCLYLAVTSVFSDDNIKRVRQSLKDVVLDSACKEKLIAPFSTDAENQQRVQSFLFESNRSMNEYEDDVKYADFVDNTSLIELLLSSGADPNHVDRCNWTPLLEYCCYGCKDIRVMNLLLKYGADVDITDSSGITALSIAVEDGTAQMVEKLLDAGADANQFSMDDLPLSLASRNKNGNEVIISIIKLLISRGAYINALDFSARTPLKEAVFNGSLEGVECLLRLGANPNIDSVSVMECKSSCLSEAVTYAEVEIAECLIDYGADIFYQNSDECSLLNIAMQEPRNDQDSFDINVALQLVTLLMERGVTIGKHDYIDLTPEKIELLEKCQHQLQTLEGTKIYSNSPTTYFEFLLKRDNELVRCLRNKNIAAAMKSEAYKKEFVYFAHRLEANYRRGLKHLGMIDDLRSMLSDVFKDVFSNELIFMISDYYNVEDLEKCFEAQSND